MPDDPDLVALIAGTAQLRDGSFRALYRATAPKLLGVVLRIVGDRNTAEDVLQEAYMRIWQGAASYRAESGRPMTWMISVARNRAIDVLRQRREAQMPRDAGGRDISEAVPDPDDRGLGFVEGDQLRICLERIDDLHRRCLLDAYHQGYTREELAERYERPVNTIKTWLHRASLSLRECLDAS